MDDYDGELDLSGYSREKLEKELLRWRKCATIDPNTGAYNTRMLEHDIKKLQERKTISPVGMLMVDIDNFTSVNNMHGHVVGDYVIERVAKELTVPLRAGDRVYRIGGDEFLVLLYIHERRESIHRDFDIEDVANREREQIESVDWREYADDLQITVSIGVAMQNSDIPLEEFKKEADQKLYVAKERGRNQVAGATGLHKVVSLFPAK